jgi:hypothetical protein
MKKDPPFLGSLNVVQMGTKRLKGRKTYLRTPYKRKHNRTVHPSQSE